VKSMSVASLTLLVIGQAFAAATPRAAEDAAGEGRRIFAEVSARNGG